MNIGYLVKGSFIVYCTIIFAAVYLKVVHAKEAGTFLIIGLIASLFFIVSAIYEVRTSKRIDKTEKTNNEAKAEAKSIRQNRHNPK